MIDPLADPRGPGRAKPARAASFIALVAACVLALPGGAGPHAAVLSEDPGDQTYFTIAINEALETRKTEVDIPLRNPDTGSHGTMIIERTYYRDPATPCRDYRRTIERADAPGAEVRGTGCRIGKALWSLDEVAVPPARRPSAGGSGAAPFPLIPGAGMPAAKPPGSAGATEAGGDPGKDPPEPAHDSPAEGTPVPSYTMPSRARL